MTDYDRAIVETHDALADGKIGYVEAITNLIDAGEAPEDAERIVLEWVDELEGDRDRYQYEQNGGPW